MPQWYFFVATDETIRVAHAITGTGVDLSFSDAMRAVDEVLTENHGGALPDDILTIGVQHFPPARFLCVGHTTTDTGKVTTTWKPFIPV